MVTLLKNLKKPKRFLNKFMESNFEKTDRLMDHYFTFQQKVIKFDKKVQDGTLKKILGDVDDDTIFIERLNAGFFALQQICIILGFIAQNESIKNRIQLHLNQRNASIDDIIMVLKEYKGEEEDAFIQSLIKNFE